MADFTTSQRERLSEENLALPDGSYPIRNRKDLQNAIASYGRAKDKKKVKQWILKRGRALDAMDLIPESWKENAMSHSLYLQHYGIKGMKWGVRRQKKREERKRRRAEKKAEKEKKARVAKWEQDVSRNWYKSYNKAADAFNPEIERINKKYEGVDIQADKKRGEKYVSEAKAAWKNAYTSQLLSDFGVDPLTNGKDWVDAMPFMDLGDVYYAPSSDDKRH